MTGEIINIHTHSVYLYPGGGYTGHFNWESDLKLHEGWEEWGSLYGGALHKTRGMASTDWIQVLFS